MTGLNFATYVRLLTKTNSTTFSDAELVLLANIVKDDFASRIKQVDEELFKIEMTTDLKASVAGDFSSREYPLDLDVINIKRVEAKLDGTNWIKLFEVDSTEFTIPLNESDIVNKFSNNEGQAKYDLSSGSLFLLTGTVTEVDEGLKLFAEINAEDIVAATLASSSDLALPSTNTKFRLPQAFHELWARKVSIIFKSSKEKPIELSTHELNFESDFQDKLDAITNPTTDRDSTMQLPDDSHLQL